jgi:hypothetical protein
MSVAHDGYLTKVLVKAADEYKRYKSPLSAKSGQILVKTAKAVQSCVENPRALRRSWTICADNSI